MTARPIAVNVVTGDLVYDEETFLGSTPAGQGLITWTYDGATLPTFLRGTVTGTANLGVTGETSRFATADNSLTTTPPDPLGDLTAYNCGFWAGLS